MDIVISVLFIITCVLLILVVLLQKGRGGGLGAALGGAGSAAFGTKVGDFMTWVTIVLTAMFLLLAIGGALYFRPPETQAGEPQILPNPAVPISEEVRVTIYPDDEEGDKVYYTTDGSIPSRGDSDLYSNAFPVFPGTVVRAIAYPQRGLPSAVVEAHYRAPQPDRPSVTPAPNPQNPITGPVEVTVKPADKGDKVYYTIDGSEPTQDKRLYSAPITVQPKMTLKVRAFAKHAPPSEIGVYTYGLKGVVPTITPPDRTPVTTQPASAPATAPAAGGQ